MILSYVDMFYPRIGSLYWNRLKDLMSMLSIRRGRHAAKSFDTFGPLGPAIVTKDEVPDPHALDIRLTIGGEVLQRSNTRELIFEYPTSLRTYPRLRRSR